MSGPYQDLAKREKLRSAKLADRARTIGQSAISATLATAARVAIASVMKDNGRGDISEASNDIRDLRTDPHLMHAKLKDLAEAERQAFAAILEALQDGLQYDATERAKVAVSESNGLEIEVKLTQQELDDLNDYPVQGLMPKEWAAKLKFLLGSGLDEAIAKPLSGSVALKAVPSLIHDVGRIHGDRLATIVTEAFYAGAKCAMSMLRKALVPNGN